MDKINIGTDTGDNILWTKARHQKWHEQHNLQNSDDLWAMTDFSEMDKRKSSGVETGKVRVLTIDDWLVADVLCSKATNVL